MPRSPQWMDLYQIWFRVFSRGRNQLCGILLLSAHGFRFCEGSKFAISHWLGRSSLTPRSLWFKMCVPRVSFSWQNRSYHRCFCYVRIVGKTSAASMSNKEAVIYERKWRMVQRGHKQSTLHRQTAGTRIGWFLRRLDSSGFWWRNWRVSKIRS